MSELPFPHVAPGGLPAADLVRALFEYSPISKVLYDAAGRLVAANAKRLVIGVSGGLDSTHALIVAAKALDRLGRPRANILGITLPGFATSEGTKGNAHRLMRSLGVAAEELAALGAPRREQVHRAYWQRVQELGFDEGDGVRRVDYLLDNYMFRGIARAQGGGPGAEGLTRMKVLVGPASR